MTNIAATMGSYGTFGSRSVDRRLSSRENIRSPSEQEERMRCGTPGLYTLIILVLIAPIVSPLERQKREGVTPTAFISNDGITLTTEETEIIESTSLGVTPTTTLPEVIPTTTLPDIISTTTLLDVIPTTNATVDNSTTEELVSAMTSVVPVTTSSVSTSPTTSSVSTSPTTSSVSTSPTSNIATLDREDHSGQAAVYAIAGGVAGAGLLTIIVAAAVYILYIKPHSSESAPVSSVGIGGEGIPHEILQMETEMAWPAEDFSEESNPCNNDMNTTGNLSRPLQRTRSISDASTLTAGSYVAGGAGGSEKRSSEETSPPRLKFHPMHSPIDDDEEPESNVYDETVSSTNSTMVGSFLDLTENCGESTQAMANTSMFLGAAGLRYGTCSENVSESMAVIPTTQCGDIPSRSVINSVNTKGQLVIHEQHDNSLIYEATAPDSADKSESQMSGELQYDDAIDILASQRVANLKKLEEKDQYAAVVPDAASCLASGSQIACPPVGATLGSASTIGSLPENKSTDSISPLSGDETELIDIAEMLHPNLLRKRRTAVGSKSQLEKSIAQAKLSIARPKGQVIPELHEPMLPVRKTAGGESNEAGEDVYSELPEVHPVPQKLDLAANNEDIAGCHEIAGSSSSYEPMQAASRFQAAAKEIRWSLRLAGSTGNCATHGHTISPSDATTATDAAAAAVAAPPTTPGRSCLEVASSRPGSGEGYVHMSFLGVLGPEMEKALKNRTKK